MSTLQTPLATIYMYQMDLYHNIKHNPCTRSFCDKLNKNIIFNIVFRNMKCIS